MGIYPRWRLKDVDPAPPLAQPTLVAPLVRGPTSTTPDWAPLLDTQGWPVEQAPDSPGRGDLLEAWSVEEAQDEPGCGGALELWCAALAPLLQAECPL